MSKELDPKEQAKILALMEKKIKEGKTKHQAMNEAVKEVCGKEK